jgi:hypothetical protein
MHVQVTDMRTLGDVETDIANVKQKINDHEGELKKATAQEDVKFYRTMLTELNAQLTEFLREKNSLGTIPPIKFNGTAPSVVHAPASVLLLFLRRLMSVVSLCLMRINRLWVCVCDLPCFVCLCVALPCCGWRDFSLTALYCIWILNQRLLYVCTGAAAAIGAPGSGVPAVYVFLVCVPAVYVSLFCLCVCVHYVCACTVCV